MNNQSIGILDSGVGGLSIWKEIVAQLPNESTIYIGDSKNCPYGVRSGQEIYILASKMVKFLLSKKVNRNLAVNFGEKLIEEKVIEIIGVDKIIQNDAWGIFKKSLDRDLSFTDCTSFVIMRDYDLKVALAFDKHFEDFGFKLLKIT